MDLGCTMGMHLSRLALLVVGAQVCDLAPYRLSGKSVIEGKLGQYYVLLRMIGVDSKLIVDSVRLPTTPFR